MIDIENEVFDTVTEPVRRQFTGVFCTGEYVAVPAEFPAVSIVEQDNSVHTKSQDSGNMENYANVMYEVNIYTNLKTRKKNQARQILAVIDEQFSSIGFTRIMSQPVPNADSTIYRIVARYRAVVSQDHVIYRR